MNQCCHDEKCANEAIIQGYGGQLLCRDHALEHVVYDNSMKKFVVHTLNEILLEIRGLREDMAIERIRQQHEHAQR